MRHIAYCLLAGFGLWPTIGNAQDAARIQQIADTMVRLCVGGGHTDAKTSGGSAGADISLRSLDVTGNLKGEFKIDSRNAEGLVNGLDNALSQVAADQADKVRACLQPVRERLLDVLLPPERHSSLHESENANPVMEVSLNDAGISLINRGGRAFNVEEKDDAFLQVACHSNIKVIMRVMMYPKRATEGVVRFWELQGLRDGVTKLTHLIKGKFPDPPVTPGTLPDFFHMDMGHPIFASFRMRISVDYEGAGRIAYHQNFGISCESFEAEDAKCDALELGSTEYAQWTDGYFGRGPTETAFFFPSSGSFDVKDAIDRCHLG